MSDTGEVITVPALLDGVRVDRAVSMLTGVSRSVAASLVGAGRVWVDGAPVGSRSVVLRQGQALVVDYEEPADAALVPERDVAFLVVASDDDVIVVDKPAGLVVHPGAGRPTGTLAGGLLARFPDLGQLVVEGVGEPDRPGIVHRLDKGTSGLLVVARTADAYRSLSAQLGARTVERGYVALAAGQLAEDRGVVDAPIGRSLRQPTRMTVSEKGRQARTSYRVLRRYDEPFSSTLLSLTLDTGRTHQIRVHLAAIGHPVVGDDRYGTGERQGRVGGAALPPGRLFLHAARLGFVHPSSAEWCRYESALPDDLASVLGEVPPLD
jgi:23S rRNA pseudouridine1911/1915/1917 synthase